MRVGDPDGYGRYGVVDVEEDGQLLCHECGRTYAHLSTHVAGTHGMTSVAYREAHGLGRTAPLIADTVRQRMAEAWKRNADLHRARLDAARDIERAATASRNVPWAPATRAKRRDAARSRRGRDLADDERARLDAADIDLDTWARIARELLTQPDVTATSIARAADVAPSTVHQRLRRYPE